MVDLLHSLQARFGPLGLPCDAPADVERFVAADRAEVIDHLDASPR